MRTLRLAAVSFLAALAVPAVGLAAPSIYAQVLQAYQTHGSIPPCQFTSAELESALTGVDTYGEQYFADFTVAIQNALAARATGVCIPGARRRAGLGGANSGFIAPSITAPTGSGVPAPVLVLAALTLLVAVTGAATALARTTSLKLRWPPALRHALGEAGYRATGTWRDLLDRRRPGRRV
jgi:hypothetical protein